MNSLDKNSCKMSRENKCKLNEVTKESVKCGGTYWDKEKCPLWVEK